MVDSLKVSQLYHTCDAALFSFTTTEELELLQQPIGQKNALKAIDFATNIQQDGYNLFAMGLSGSGKHSTVMSFLQTKADKEATPSDWCYVNNFKNEQKPIAIELPPGDARRFKDDIDELIDLLKAILPTVFTSNNYRDEREAINQKHIDKKTEIFQELQEKAHKYDVSMNSISSGRVTFVPIINGKVLSAEEFNAIKGKEKEKITKRMGKFELIVKEALHNVGELNKDMQKEFKALQHKITQEAVESLIDEVRNKYRKIEKIVNYLDALQDDIIHHVQDFLVNPDEMNIAPFMKEFYTPTFASYKINLFISHDKNSNTSVIFEDNPIHQNLIGKIEHLS